MLVNIVLNFCAALIAVSLSSSVAFHDSRLNVALFSPAVQSGDTSSHDAGHALSHEFHIHGSRQVLSEANDPALAIRSHKKHLPAHHSRLKYAALTI